MQALHPRGKPFGRNPVVFGRGTGPVSPCATCVLLAAVSSSGPPGQLLLPENPGCCRSPGWGGLRWQGNLPVCFSGCYGDTGPRPEHCLRLTRCPGVQPGLHGLDCLMPDECGAWLVRQIILVCRHPEQSSVTGEA